jgi:hypothetical protein
MALFGGADLLMFQDSGSQPLALRRDLQPDRRPGPIPLGAWAAKGGEKRKVAPARTVFAGFEAS